MLENKKSATQVLHVLNELKPSGAEIMLEAAGEIWVRANVVASILSVGERIGPFSSRLSNAGYELFHLPRSSSPSFLLKLYKLFSKFDVIHIHTEHWNFIYGLIARLAGCRVVRTIHNNFQYRGLTGIKLRLQRFILRCIGVKHVAISKGVSDNEVDFYKNTTHIVNNWLSTSKFNDFDSISRVESRNKFDVPEDAIVITVIGNCSEIKNHKLLLGVLPSIISKHQNACLLHAGSGADEQEERKLVAQLGIENHVKFLGHISDIPALMKSSDIFVMPSMHEGFSIAVLEALYCGLPCALSARPGLVGLDAEFSTVHYFSLDPNDCANTIINMINNYGSINLVKTREHNTNVVQHAYTPEAGCLKYASIYHQE